MITFDFRVAITDEHWQDHWDEVRSTLEKEIRDCGADILRDAEQHHRHTEADRLLRELADRLNGDPGDIPMDLRQDVWDYVARASD